MHDDIIFVEFDRNSNFVHDDILPDFVVHSKNQENYSSCRVNFIRDGIVDNFMK